MVDLNSLPTNDNWDSYGAKATSLAARRALDALHVVPTANGGVQIEFYGGGIEIEIEINQYGKFESIFIAPPIGTVTD